MYIIKHENSISLNRKGGLQKGTRTIDFSVGKQIEWACPSVNDAYELRFHKEKVYIITLNDG